MSTSVHISAKLTFMGYELRSITFSRVRSALKNQSTMRSVIIQLTKYLVQTTLNQEIGEIIYVLSVPVKMVPTYFLLQ
jgi:hypothetical protein